MKKRIKKELLNRCFIGSLGGLLIAQIISILISLIKNDGNYYHVAPELVAVCKSETRAVIVQTLCALLYGAVWVGSTVIWQIDKWSILKQNIIHFLITSIVVFPIAYVTGWMMHTPLGILIYFGTFLIVYAIIWLTQYFAIKKNIKKMNAAVNANTDD